MPRYDRLLSVEAAEAVGPGGRLHFLVAKLNQLIPSELCAFDVQVRKDAVQVYHGTTSLLRIRFTPGVMCCEAADAYRKAEGFAAVMRPWSLRDSDEGWRFESLVCTYLSSAVHCAASRYYRNRKEGYWQNGLSYAFGRDWNADKEWLIVDREAVLGFETSHDHEAFTSFRRQAYVDVRQTLRRRNPKLWGKHPPAGRLCDELDFVAIGRDSELLCIELKHGSDAAGVYWGPLQAALYRDYFQTALPSISADVERLIRQKIELGLLPENAATRLPKDGFRSAQARLIVAQPKERSSCWSRIDDLFDECDAARIPVQVVDSYFLPVPRAVPDSWKREPRRPVH